MINLNKNVFVYDIECDGLIEDATKIHCLSIAWRDGSVIKTKSTTDYDEMRKFFNNDKITRIGHNITLYDERVASKLLGIDTLKTKDNLIDTLALSWYLFPERKVHGLESWGNDIGIKKVEIKDWKNLTSQEYIHRCEEDTKINLELWERCLYNLENLYDHNNGEIVRLIEYLQFKLDCVREQEDTKLKLDIPHITSTLAKLQAEKNEKEEALKNAMPQVPIKTTKVYKNVIVLEDGSIVTKGDMSFEHYFSEGYRPKMEFSVEKIKGYAPPNPNSTDQKKNWLYSLGWVPETFNVVKDKKTGENRKVPQIGSKDKDGSVCESIKKLYDKEPALQVLEGLSVLSHRISILEGFLENQKDGYIEASMAGLTNTLRLKHSKIVNLPGEAKKYGKEIRGSLIAEEGGILCGSDMSALEDSTKQHYIYFHDPKYVEEMRTPGFDPHLDIGLRSGLMTQEEVDYFKLPGTDKVKFGLIKAKRHKAKTTNFSSIYGVGAEKLARELGIPLKEAKKLLKGYWERNIAVKKISEETIVKQIGAKKWLFNPVSKFWYSLRAEKDRFSTLNQGTGVYAFDTYIKYVRKQGIKISLQMHDEILFKTDKIMKDAHYITLKKCIDYVNDELKLNVPLGISADFGLNYADCH